MKMMSQEVGDVAARLEPQLCRSRWSLHCQAATGTRRLGDRDDLSGCIRGRIYWVTLLRSRVVSFQEMESSSGSRWVNTVTFCSWLCRSASIHSSKLWLR